MTGSSAWRVYVGLTFNPWVVGPQRLGVHERGGTSVVQGLSRRAGR